MIMFFVFVRMLITLAAVFVAIGGGLICYAIGDTRRATGLVIFCAFVAWMAKPDAEELAAFAEFQKQRAARHGIKL